MHRGKACRIRKNASVSFFVVVSPLCIVNKVKKQRGDIEGETRMRTKQMAKNNKRLCKQHDISKQKQL